MTVGVSLERTNHCFTWLNGDVQERQQRRGTKSERGLIIEKGDESKAANVVD